MCPCLTTEATAEQRFRSGYPRALRLALLLAALIHAVLVLAVPKIEVAPYRLPPGPAGVKASVGSASLIAGFAMP